MKLKTRRVWTFTQSALSEWLFRRTPGASADTVDDCKWRQLYYDCFDSANLTILPRASLLPYGILHEAGGWSSKHLVASFDANAVESTINVRPVAFGFQVEGFPCG
jgi:hypothetical protein